MSAYNASAPVMVSTTTPNNAAISTGRCFNNSSPQSGLIARSDGWRRFDRGLGSTHALADGYAEQKGADQRDGAGHKQEDHLLGAQLNLAEALIRHEMPTMVARQLRAVTRRSCAAVRVPPQNPV